MNEQLLSVSVRVCVCVPDSLCSCVVVTGVIAAWNRKSVSQNNNDYSHDLLHPTPYPGVYVCVRDRGGHKKQGRYTHLSSKHTLGCVIGCVCLHFCPFSLLLFCHCAFSPSFCLHFSRSLSALPFTRQLRVLESTKPELWKMSHILVILFYLSQHTATHTQTPN